MIAAERSPDGDGAGAGAKEPRNGVASVVITLRDMILARRLPPGVQLRQEDMAQQLRISRVPLREALRVLATEGLLTHRPHQGYFVTALSQRELGQINSLLQFLETELIRSVVWPDDDQLTQLRSINESMRKASVDRDHATVNRSNREFHMAIFRMSPLEMYIAEAERFWLLSDPYRLLHVATTDPAVALAEHEQLLDALAAQDRALCLRVLSQHRQETNLAAAAVLNRDGLVVG